MDSIIKKVIFIVGLGTPADLYTDYLDDLKKQMPQIELLVLAWWNQDDFGINLLRSYIDDSHVILIAHSAGGVIAFQALAKWPELIKKIIMLDSHFLRTPHALSTVAHMLDTILSKDNKVIQDKVKNAYAPILHDDATFNKALKFAVNWVNEHFDPSCNLLKMMPAHSVLFIGFTNSNYQILNDKDKSVLLRIWNKFNVDVKFFLINHFDLIESKSANDINQLIVDWLVLKR